MLIYYPYHLKSTIYILLSSIYAGQWIEVKVSILRMLLVVLNRILFFENAIVHVFCFLLRLAHYYNIVNWSRHDSHTETICNISASKRILLQMINLKLWPFSMKYLRKPLISAPCRSLLFKQPLWHLTSQASPRTFTARTLRTVAFFGKLPRVPHVSLRGLQLVCFL
jgi:hypothetical protein